MDTIEKMFGSIAKARLMRAFVYNPNTVFSLDSISKQIKSKPDLVKKELKVLRDMGLIHNRQTKNLKGRKVNGFVLDTKFAFLDPLREFLLRVSPLSEHGVIRKLSNAGRAKLIVVSGIFLNNDEARADMLIVSDKPDEKKVGKAVSEISAEFGREVSFALFSSEDFSYRMNMGDKLVRDIFDFPHRVLLNKIGLEE